MTGNVPYYGGRLTPGQAYAASHQPSPLPPSADAPRPARSREQSLADLQNLLTDGLISEAEYRDLQDRLER